MSIERGDLQEIASYSVLTCLQQSVMNFGILLVQGVVNGFGPDVMAAFAAGVKIDSFVYMPVQDLGNAYSVFAAQNKGACREDRIQLGFRKVCRASGLFAVMVSILVWVFAKDLMGVFITGSPNIVAEGVRYLHVEGAFYVGIAVLFLLYGYFRAIGWPGMSLVLTVISLGTRVVLAYVAAYFHNVSGVWWGIPIGWLLADAIGLMVMKRREKSHIE